MRSILLVLSLYILQAFCKVPQDDWTNPINTQAGQTMTILTNGQSFTIGWNSNLTTWFPTYSPNTSTTNADLWVTGYDLHQYQHLVASSVNVASTRSVTWKVNLPADEVDEVATWVFRFIQSGLMPNQTKYEISSAACVIRANPSAVTSSSSTTSSMSSTSSSTSTSTSTSATSLTSTATSATASAVPTGASTGATGTPNSSTTSGGLSTGAKAGIAVGAVLGAILLIGAGWFLARRKPKQNRPSDEFAAPAMVAGRPPSRNHREEKQFVEPNHQPVPPYSHQPYQGHPPFQEMHADAPQQWHQRAELGNHR